jgi:hypothetical protein
MHRDPNMNGNRRYVFTEARIDCKALTAQIEVFCAVPGQITGGVTVA